MTQRTEVSELISARYCASMAQDEWSARLAQTVGQEIRRHRNSQKLSAQKLADACAAVGLPLERAVIANLENGRRGNVTVAELLVLARVLRVSPLQLVFPVGRAETVEVLPELQVPTWAAAKWFAGEGPHVGDEVLVDWPRSRELELFRKHDEIERRFRQESGAARVRRDLLAGAVVVGAERQRLLENAELNERLADSIEAELRAHRALMRKEGLRLPELPPELHHLDAMDPS